VADLHGLQAATDEVCRPAAGAGEGRGGGTLHGSRGARVQAGRADGQGKPVAQIEHSAILARVL